MLLAKKGALCYFLVSCSMPQCPTSAMPLELESLFRFVFSILTAYLPPMSEIEVIESVPSVCLLLQGYPCGLCHRYFDHWWCAMLTRGVAHAHAQNVTREQLHVLWVNQSDLSRRVPIPRPHQAHAIKFQIETIVYKKCNIV